jgi:NADPH:quinone reductase-like Zn-dependent oxidoreductase
MLAIVQDSYGSADVLQLRAIPAPVVGDREVLVRVRAACVHPDVWHVLIGRPHVLRIMGAGCAGHGTGCRGRTWQGRSRRSAGG